MMDWNSKSEDRKYNFCCAADWQHYRLHFIHWDPPIRVEYENVILYVPLGNDLEQYHRFSITQIYDTLRLTAKTDITILLVDPEQHAIEEFPKVSYNQKLFDFSQTNREKIANRMKTILVFQ
jgi:hypothetical protein